MPSDADYSDFLKTIFSIQKDEETGVASLVIEPKLGMLNGQHDLIIGAHHLYYNTLQKNRSRIFYY